MWFITEHLYKCVATKVEKAWIPLFSFIVDEVLRTERPNMSKPLFKQVRIDWICRFLL